jgi:hypothetical protein
MFFLWRANFNGQRCAYFWIKKSRHFFQVCHSNGNIFWIYNSFYDAPWYKYFGHVCLIFETENSTIFPGLSFKDKYFFCTTRHLGENLGSGSMLVNIFKKYQSIPELRLIKIVFHDPEKYFLLSGICGLKFVTQNPVHTFTLHFSNIYIIVIHCRCSKSPN